MLWLTELLCEILSKLILSFQSNDYFSKSVGVWKRSLESTQWTRVPPAGGTALRFCRRALSKFNRERERD